MPEEPFPVEQIPGEHHLFHFLNKKYRTARGTLRLRAFADPELSCDWEHYSTAEDTHARAVTNFDGHLDDWAVFKLNVGQLRSVTCGDVPLVVEHRPIQRGEQFGPNQAHSVVLRTRLQNGAEEEYRVKMNRLAAAPGNPVIPWKAEQ